MHLNCFIEQPLCNFDKNQELKGLVGLLSDRKLIGTNFDAKMSKSQRFHELQHVHKQVETCLLQQ